MRHFLSRQLNIYPGEWRRVMLLYAISFVYVVGIIWATIALHAAFLEQVGPQYLPLFFVVKALLSIPAVALYTAVADRWSPDRLFIAIFLGSVAAFALGMSLLTTPLGSRRLLIAFMYLIVFVPLSDIQAIHWNTYVNHFYDTRTARRIIPVLVTAFGVASVVAGEGLGLLTRLGWDTTGIVFASMGLMTLASLLIWLMRRLLHADAAPPTAVSQSATFQDSVQEGYRFVTSSPLLRWMALSVFILMVLFTFADYVISQTLAIQLTETEITRFLGRITSITNLLLLPIQILFLNRLVSRIGLGNANLLFPVGNVLAAASLFFAPGMLWPAAVAQANRAYLYGSIGYPIQNLLYNAVPLRIKGRARAFIGGLVTPVAMLFGSLLLQGLQLLDDAVLYPALAILTAVLSTGYLGVSLLLRRQYARALISLLEQEDYAFLLHQDAAELRITDPATLRSLAQKLEQSRRPELTIFLVRLLADVGGSAALPVLEPAIRRSDPAIRASLLETLAAAGLRGETTRRLFHDHLLAADPAVRQAALSGLARLHGVDSAPFQTVAAQMLADPGVAVQLTALPALLRARTSRHHDKAISTTLAILRRGSSAQQAAALRMLGEVGGRLAIRLLLPHTTAPAEDVRLAAALALETIAAAAPPPAEMRAEIGASMTLLTADPVARIRQAALVVLGGMANDAVLPDLLEGLADHSPQVRDTAVAMLEQIGPAALPALQAYLPGAGTHGRHMATLALARIQPRHFDTLVTASIEDNLRAIYRHLIALPVLAPMYSVRGMLLLSSALQEENSRLLDEIFHLLTAFQPAGALQVIRDSLASGSDLVRANAAEALESVTSPQTALLVTPLLAPEQDFSTLQALGQQEWRLGVPTPIDAMRQLLNNYDSSPWLRTIAAYVLGEIGAAFLPKTAERPRRQPPEQAAPAPPDSAAAGTPQNARQQRRARRRQRAADLLDMLSAETPPEAGQPEPAAMATLDTMYQPPPIISRRFKLPEVIALLQQAQHDPDGGVRHAAAQARRRLKGERPADLNAASATKEMPMLSMLDRILFLKEVPFFQSMTVDQLRVLAGVCEESFFPSGTQIYQTGDAGGELFVVVNGRVALEQPGQRHGSVLRLGTVDAYGYFGEMNLFNASPRDASARAIQETLTLRLKRAPLLALIRRHPDLSLELINVLSQRLQEAYAQVASRTRSTPRELHTLFDQLDE